MKRHENADSLYVEQIEMGDPAPRTVVSGLVKYIPIENMRVRPWPALVVAEERRSPHGHLALLIGQSALQQDQMVIVLANLKPAK